MQDTTFAFYDAFAPHLPDWHEASIELFARGIAGIMRRPRPNRHCAEVLNDETGNIDRFVEYATRHRRAFLAHLSRRKTTRENGLPPTCELDSAADCLFDAFPSVALPQEEQLDAALDRLYNVQIESLPPADIINRYDCDDAYYIVEPPTDADAQKLAPVLLSIDGQIVSSEEKQS